jgi:hypothetical protein
VRAPIDKLKGREATGADELLGGAGLGVWLRIEDPNGEEVPTFSWHVLPPCGHGNIVADDEVTERKNGITVGEIECQTCGWAGSVSQGIWVEDPPKRRRRR